MFQSNEPRSARKPIPRKRVAGRDKPPSSDTFPATPKKKSAATRKPLAPQFQNGDSDSEGHTYPESVQSSKVSNSLGSPCDSKKKKAPRLTKKAILAAEQGRREAYAQELFNELNESVFNGGIPPETTLKWSNRLLTTAGRARWHKYVWINLDIHHLT